MISKITKILDVNVNETRYELMMHVYHDALKKYLLDTSFRDIDKHLYNALLDDYRGFLFDFLNIFIWI